MNYFIEKRNKKGFTIVELIVVIAVIAILAAILVPTFLNARQNANSTEADLNASLSLLYTDKNGQTLPPEFTGIDGNITSLTITPKLPVYLNQPNDGIKIKIVTSTGREYTDKSLCGWTSSNEDMVVVSTKGVVQGLVVTSTPVIVTATVGGKSATCEVTVDVAPATQPATQSDDDTHSTEKGGQLGFECKHNSNGVCSVTSDALVDLDGTGNKFHKCTTVDEAIKHNCMYKYLSIKTTKTNEDGSVEEIVPTDFFNGDTSSAIKTNGVVPIIKMFGDYNGDITFPYRISDSEGNSPKKLYAVLDLNGHTLNGKVTMNCAGTVTSGVPDVMDSSRVAPDKVVTYTAPMGTIKSDTDGINCLGLFDGGTVNQGDIMNVRIEAAQNGITFLGGAFSRNYSGIMDCEIIAGDDYSGILVPTSDNSNMRILSRNKVYGGTALYYRGNSGDLICGNYFIGKTYGIHLNSSTTPFIFDNYCYGNDSYGIYVEYSNSKFLRGNYAESKNSNGFCVNNGVEPHFFNKIPDDNFWLINLSNYNLNDYITTKLPVSYYGNFKNGSKFDLQNEASFYSDNNPAAIQSTQQSSTVTVNAKYRHGTFNTQSKTFTTDTKTVTGSKYLVKLK